MRVSRQEQETIITFNEAESTAEVYTHNRALIKKLDLLCGAYPYAFSVKLFDENSKTYIIPKNLISIRKPTKISDEVKEKRKRLMKNLNEGKE